MMIRNLISLLLAVTIAFTSICCPAYAGEDTRSNSGGFLDWLGTAIAGAAAAETTKIVVCTLLIPEFPPAAIPCGAAFAAEATGAATAVTSKALQETAKSLAPIH